MHNKRVLNRFISEKPKGRANKSKERAKRRVGSKKEGMGAPPPPPQRGQFGSYGCVMKYHTKYLECDKLVKDITVIFIEKINSLCVRGSRSVNNRLQ